MPRRTSALAASAITAAALLVAASAGPAEPRPAFDTILRHGTIVDGTGQRAYRADVGIRDGHIHAIGDLRDATAATDLDVAGMTVAPGFVDIHSHADEDELPDARSALMQGVTTEVLNPDGGGPTDLNERWALEGGGLAINIAAYVGFNSIWSEVVGQQDRRATAEEIARMRALVARGMRDGAWGVSSGLAYTPAFYADTDEVIQVVEAARAWRTNYPSHIRNEREEVVESTAEAIRIGEEAGLAPVITHMKVMGPANWGRSVETLRLIEEANARGTYAAADQYPYLASQTGLTALVPAWAQEGGTQAMLARFADPAQRPRIEGEIAQLIAARTGTAEGVYFASKRQTLAQVATALGVSPAEATMRIIEAEGSISTIYFFGHEDDVRRIMASELVAIASDGGTTGSAATHPRHYGTQPRVLGRYVREAGVLSREDAIRKMTGLPATLIGMVDRGFLAPGMVADITVFDPDTIVDRGTFEEPRQCADGVRHVLIGGTLAVRDGEPTGARAGRALKRSPSMPTRRMGGERAARAAAHGVVEVGGGGAVAIRSLAERGAARAGDGGALATRSLSGRGAARSEGGQRIVLRLAVEQAAGARRARGSVRLAARGWRLRSVRLGRLQVADRWASVTGVGRVAGEDRAFLVIVDRADPTAPPGRTSVTIRMHGVGEIAGVLRGWPPR